MDFYYYDNYMARPPKDPSLRMDQDLRIPVTADQKALIAMAAAARQLDVATWVRPILIKAAQSQVVGKQERKS
jgi:uncharacterized protein (DUF1778 family)